MFRTISIFLVSCLLLAAVSVSDSFAGETVTVTQIAPSSAQPGHEFTLEVTISKGNIQGFAKYQCELSEGLLAKEGDSKNASFTFVDQKVKFIWMALPSEAEFKVSCKIMVSSTFSAPKATITGSFSYVENNETQKYKVAPLDITVEATAPLGKAEEPKSKLTIIDGSGKKTEVPSGATPAQKTEEIKLEPKPELKSEPIAESKPEPKPAPESVVKIEPKEEQKSAAVSPASPPPPVKEEEKKEEKKLVSVINGQGSSSGELIKEEPKVVAVINSNGSSKGASATKPATAPPPPAPEKKSAPVTAPAPSSKDGIIFRVQIAVTHNPNDLDSLKTKSGLSKIYGESSDGVSKFTAGDCKTYTEAGNLKNELKKKGFEGAFVVAYKNGTRINIQDAIKEASQK